MIAFRFICAVLLLATLGQSITITIEKLFWDQYAALIPHTQVRGKLTLVGRFDWNLEYDAGNLDRKICAADGTICLGISSPMWPSCNNDVTLTVFYQNTSKDYNIGRQWTCSKLIGEGNMGNYKDYFISMPNTLTFEW